MPVLFIRNGELVELQNFNAEHKKPLEYPKAFNFTLSMSPHPFLSSDADPVLTWLVWQSLA